MTATSGGTNSPNANNGSKAVNVSGNTTASNNTKTTTTDEAASSTGSMGGTAAATNGANATNNNNSKTISVSKTSTKTNTSTASATGAGGNSANNGGKNTVTGSYNTNTTNTMNDNAKTTTTSTMNNNSKTLSVSNTSSNNKNSNNTNTNTTDNANSSTNINATLADSVVGSGSLSQTTTDTRTVGITAGAGSAVNNASVAGNKYMSKGAGGFSGDVSMTYSMGGQGILQAAQNTGAGAVQQNSVALTSTVGGNGGGLNGFSPTITPATK